MATIAESLFGVTPESLQRQRQQQLRQEAMDFASLSDPFQQANFAIYQGAGNLARGVGGLLGAQDPELAKATALQGIMRQADTTTPEGLTALARNLTNQGFGAQAMQVAEQAQQAKLRGAQTAKALGDVRQQELTFAQEQKLREELRNLGDNPSEEEYLKVVRKYGDPDKVMQSIQTTMNQRAAAEARIEQAKTAAAARLEEARLRGATQLQIAQMMADSRREIAQLVGALKGPSAAVLKAQEKANQMAEGQRGLEDTTTVAKKLVEDITDMGGMTTTSKGALSNLITSLGTSAVGQAGARLVGTEAQSKRDELASVRLQLFNAVKEATGMTSTQLNSNVELQTWLNSLGSPQMSKEANLAILTNIEDRYLKNPPSARANMGAQTPPGTQAPMYATNPTTKERIVSTDGGKTWTKTR